MKWPLGYSLRYSVGKDLYHLTDISKWLNSHLFEWDSVPGSGHYLAVFNLIYRNHSKRCTMVES